MTLPNFLVIGAQRAGTTLLHTLLEAHPEVYVPKRRKEVHYFDWYYGRGPEWYESFFPSGDEATQYRAIGEVTPDYLFTPDVAQRIHTALPQCRLIVSLRNPTTRAYSWYLYARRSFNERRSFETYIEQEPDVLRRGCYHSQLMAYLDYFPKTQLCILIYEEMIRQPERDLERIAGFLGLAAAWNDIPALFGQRLNSSEQPYLATAFALARQLGTILRHHDQDWLVESAKRLGLTGLFGKRHLADQMTAEMRCRLARFYAEDVRRLEDLLERDLSLWTPGPATPPATLQQNAG